MRVVQPSVIHTRTAVTYLWSLIYTHTHTHVIRMFVYTRASLPSGNRFLVTARARERKIDKTRGGHRVYVYMYFRMRVRTELSLQMESQREMVFFMGIASSIYDLIRPIEWLRCIGRWYNASPCSAARGFVPEWVRAISSYCEYAWNVIRLIDGVDRFRMYIYGWNFKRSLDWIIYELLALFPIL